MRGGDEEMGRGEKEENEKGGEGERGKELMKEKEERGRRQEGRKGLILPPSSLPSTSFPLPHPPCLPYITV